MTTPSAQLEPTLERTVAHLRAHVAELHRLEQARAAPAELEERRELIARIQVELVRRWCGALLSNNNERVLIAWQTATGARRCCGRLLHAMIRVAFLDDHPVVRAGLQASLATERDLQLVGFAADEHALWPVPERTRQQSWSSISTIPDGGLALCLQIKRQPDPPAVLLYSAYTPAALVVAAAVAGADGIVSKSSGAATLVDAIRAVARNPGPIPAISPQMKTNAAAGLDPADHAVLAMRVAGDLPVEIATTLGVPEPTIAKSIAAVIANLEPLRSAT